VCKLQEKHGLSREETLKSIFQEETKMANEIKEKETEKKTFKERINSVKSFVKEKKGIIVPTALGLGGIIAGAIGHAIVDNAVNGGKQVAWYDHYREQGDLKETIVHNVSPTIRDIKRKNIDSAHSWLTQDPDEIEKTKNNLGVDWPSN
jgi:hypothetical protein